MVGKFFPWMHPIMFFEFVVRDEVCGYPVWTFRVKFKVGLIFSYFEIYFMVSFYCCRADTALVMRSISVYKFALI